MDEKELDYVLSRGRLSGAQKEQILEEALAKSAPPRHSAWQRFVRSLAGSPLRWAAVAGCAAACLVLPAIWYLGDDAPGLVPKGVSGLVVEAGCKDTCRPGETLGFRVQGLRAPGHLAAYAVDQAGSRIWYFPTEAGEMPAVAPSAEPWLLPQGIRVGLEHAPGTYQVHVLVVPEPLSRQEIEELSVADLVGHVVQSLEIAP